MLWLQMDPESMSTESAGLVSVSILSFSVRSYPCSGSHGILGSAGFSQVGGLRLGVSQQSSRPPDSMHMHTGGQMSTSLVTGIIAAEVHAEFEQSLLHFFMIAAGHGHRCRRARLLLIGPSHI